MWRLYYADGSRIDGVGAADWMAAPDDEVQVLALLTPYPNAPYPGWTPWAGAKGDRQLWTGEDAYTLSDWPPKRGSWMNRADYDMIWNRACGE